MIWLTLKTSAALLSVWMIYTTPAMPSVAKYPLGGVLLLAWG